MKFLQKPKEKSKKIIKDILEFLSMSDKLGQLIGGRIGSVLKVFDVIVEFVKKKYEERLAKKKEAKNGDKEKTSENTEQ